MLIGLICFAFCIRLIVFIQSLDNQNSYLTNDTESYNSTALAWLQTGSFSYSLDHLDIPETLRTPGYPFFLGIIYKVFGEGYSSVVLIQIFLSLLSTYVIYLIGTIIFNKKIGLFTALIFSLDPVTISMNYKILSNTFLIFSYFVYLIWNIMAKESNVIFNPIYFRGTSCFNNSNSTNHLFFKSFYYDWYYNLVYYK